jgi:F-type H+-transporting ATPase subunit gamma
VARARELRKRIKSVESTRKITRTMELVATSKLKRSQDRVVATRPYATKLRDMLAAVAAAAGANASHTLLRTPDVVKRTSLFLITANRGLCGAFNANLIRLARTSMDAAIAAGGSVDLYVVGKKGIAFFRYNKVEMKETYATLSDRPTFDEAEKLAQTFIDKFTKGETDQVDVIYSQFLSAGRQVPVVERLLPVPKPAADPKKPAAAIDFLFEPGPVPILDSLLPLYVKVSVLGALVNSQASEQSARRIAMKNATDNAGDLLRSLRLTYNKARQSQITQELAEIMGGVEALKG